MKNAEWLQKAGYRFSDLQVYKNYSNDKSWDYGIKIFKNSMKIHVKGDGHLDALTRWLDEEHVEPILDYEERKYISSVIRPFKNEIKSIEKCKSCSNDLERLYFSTKDDEFYLKNFKAGTMYKGMEIGKEYTLKELGL